MKPTRLSVLAHWLNASVHGEDRFIEAISHDSRSLNAGSLHVALRGERFDGHVFASSAVQHGAVALLVEQLQPVNVPQIVVKNTQTALAVIATEMQRARDTRVFAITGSNGKTTVKALLLSILEQATRRQGKTVYATPGNRNNEIGLPLAVIDAPDSAQYAIYEMGAGQSGDIAYLSAIARPHYALVNNVANAHLERMHSLLGVAQTKGAIYQALPEHGVAVINADEAFSPWFEQQCVPQHSHVLRFALEHSAEITAQAVRLQTHYSVFNLFTPQGQAEIHLPLPGRHNISNALAAAALAHAAHVPLSDIVIGLETVQPVAGRQTTHVLGNGAIVIDDSYNANPASLAAAIAVLAMNLDKDKTENWLVLGDMRELGENARALHAQAGQCAQQAGISRLYALGELSAAAAESFGAGARHFASHADLALALAEELHAGVRCLIKGSRGSAMEKIVHALLLPQSGDTHHVA